MWGPDGWENNLPVFSYLAKYTDSQDVVINVDKRIGGTWEELEDYAWKLADPLGRIPDHSRTGTKRIDVNYGKKSNKFFDTYTKYFDTVQFSLQLIQRYTYRVLQTIQLKLILSWVWAERAVLGRAKTALKFKYEI